jgi:hypothetical protein
LNGRVTNCHYSNRDGIEMKWNDCKV